VKKTTCTLLFCLLPLGQTLANNQHPHIEKWHVIKSTDPLTLEPVYRAELDGLVQDEGRSKKKIRLIVRCQNKKAQLLINWHKFLGDESVAVSHAIDGEPSDTSLWEVIGERTTTSLPNATALFVQRMQDGRKLEVNVKPWRGQPINAVFHLDGAESALADISKDCH